MTGMWSWAEIMPITIAVRTSLHLQVAKVYSGLWLTLKSVHAHTSHVFERQECFAYNTIEVV